MKPHPQRGIKSEKIATRPSFAVDRARHGSFIDQMADALKAAIESGYYEPGDILPTLESLAAEGGTSLYIPRAAMKRLTDEGYVVPRPGIGSVVMARGGRVWRGHVVLVTREMRDNFLNATVVAVLRAHLMRDGYLVSQIAVPADLDTEPDFAQLDLLLAKSVTLAAVVGDDYGVGAHIARLGVPVVTFGDAARGTDGALAHVRTDFRAAYRDFAGHCRERGVRRAACFWFGGRMPLASILRRAGIDATILRVPCPARTPANRFGDVERVSRITLEYVDSLFRDPAFRLPDVLCFTDNHAAAGALVALQCRGVRLPEDVGLVTQAMPGIGPVWWKPLTRFELDPVAAGETFAETVADILTGRAPAPRSCRAAYVRGETF